LFLPYNFFLRGDWGGFSQPWLRPCTISEINGDFGRKSQFFPHLCI